MELRKLLIYLLCVTLFAIPVTAGVEFEISKDNTTWKPINSSAYEGTLDTSNSIGLAQVLNPITTYYVRAKNDSTNWTYKSFKTIGDKDMTGIMLAFIATIVVFGLFGFFSKGPVVKIAAYGVSFLELTAMFFVAYMNELNESLAAFLNINFTAILIMVGAIGGITIMIQMARIFNPTEDHTNELKWRDRR